MDADSCVRTVFDYCGKCARTIGQEAQSKLMLYRGSVGDAFGLATTNHSKSNTLGYP